MLDAELADARVLGGRCGPPHLGAGAAGDLGRGDADAARGGVDEHALAGLQPAVADEPAPRGRVVDRDRGGLGEGEALGDVDEVGLADGDELGLAAEARAGHDPPAGAAHDARDLVAEDGGERRRVLVEALAGHVLGEVHALRRAPRRSPRRRPQRDRDAPEPGAPRSLRGG
jgi:hypothetical protein